MSKELKMRVGNELAKMVLFDDAENFLKRLRKNYWQSNLQMNSFSCSKS